MQMIAQDLVMLRDGSDRTQRSGPGSEVRVLTSTTSWYSYAIRHRLSGQPTHFGVFRPGLVIDKVWSILLDRSTIFYHFIKDKVHSEGREGGSIFNGLVH